VDSRLDLARKLGATQVINAGKENPAEKLMAMGGVHYVIEASGVPAALEQALQVTRSNGICGILGVPSPTATLTVNIMTTFSSKNIMGIIEGGADPQVFIPYMVDKFMAGEFPIDLLAKFYTLDTIDKAVADSKSGATVKPILRMGA
jgi:aryl-alcohol dehydrogenase